LFCTFCYKEGWSLVSALLVRFLILCVSLLCSLSIPYSMDQDPTLAFSHHLPHALSLLRLCKAAQNTKYSRGEQTNSAFKTSLPAM